MTGAESRMGSTTYWQEVWRKFKKNRPAMTGLVIIVLLVCFAVIGPYLTTYSYSAQDLSSINQGPGVRFWFGSDDLGRDIFTRIWYGARISLTVGVLTGLAAAVIGAVYGGISGITGGKLDELMMRFIEILWSVPFLLYVIVLIVIMEPGLAAVVTALGTWYWVPMARVVRGQVLALKEQDFVLAARCLGAGPGRVLFRHLLPNAMGPIIVQMTVVIPEAIFTEAFLSFLGLGVSAPMASWGVLASEGIKALKTFPWQLFFPAFFITVTILAFNILGDGLRDALDPKCAETTIDA